MPDYINAYKFCTNHKEQLLKDNKCGCFYCLTIFNPEEINFWISDKYGTAMCPYCGIDSVFGESSGYPITKEFLKKMHSCAAVVLIPAVLKYSYNANEVVSSLNYVLFKVGDWILKSSLRDTSVTYVTSYKYQ